MFISWLLIAAALTAIHIRLASAFQLGSDYDVYKTANLCNCTGNIPVSNVTVPNAFDTLPQIDPSSGHGWEQWTLFVHGTYQLILRWNQGDPSSPEPSSARFDILVLDANGTLVQGTVIGDLSYKNDEYVKQITIGNNSLTWDSDALWYNASVSVDGYQFQLNSFSATLDAFHPNVAFHNGLLDQSGAWFGSVPVIRGHVTGSFVTPTKENVTLEALSVVRHMFSENPLPSYINKYTGGAIWGYSTTFYDSHIFYQTETTDGTVHEAAFLGRALPTPDLQSDFTSAWATYAVADDNLYNLSIDAAENGINASLSGCADTNNISYLFNTTVVTLLGEFPDLGGGMTSYYRINNGTTTAPFDGVVTNGLIAGIFETYEAPLKSLQLG